MSGPSSGYPEIITKKICNFAYFLKILGYMCSKHSEPTWERSSNTFLTCLVLFVSVFLHGHRLRKGKEISPVK